MTQHKTYGAWTDLKVYGWTGLVYSGEQMKRFADYYKVRDDQQQSRCIVAASSQAAAARAAGVKAPRNLWNLCETQNVIEAGVALNQPGVVFWRPLDGHHLPYI